MADIRIRKANITDAATLLFFVKELAECEKARDQVTATITDIEKTVFGPGSTVFALICEVDGTPAGHAVYYFNYSTWLGEYGLYLEDLYVSEKYRGFGAGKALFAFLAKTALDNKCSRFEFSVLDWNRQAIDFYKTQGAQAQSEWVKYRVSGESLAKLAGKQGQA